MFHQKIKQEIRSNTTLPHALSRLLTHWGCYPPKFLDPFMLGILWVISSKKPNQTLLSHALSYACSPILNPWFYIATSLIFRSRNRLGFVCARTLRKKTHLISPPVLFFFHSSLFLTLCLVSEKTFRIFFFFFLLVFGCWENWGGE